jgi:hypothetical protein
VVRGRRPRRPLCDARCYSEPRHTLPPGTGLPRSGGRPQRRNPWPHSRCPAKPIPALNMPTGSTSRRSTIRPYQPALMIFNDGQAFMATEGDARAQNVMDNLIYRREIPVMIGVFINPGPPARSSLGRGLPTGGLSRRRVPRWRKSDSQSETAVGNDSGAAEVDDRASAKDERDGHARIPIRNFRRASLLRTRLPHANTCARGGRFVEGAGGRQADVSPGPERTADFGSRCLQARRPVERGVRFSQLYSGGGPLLPSGMRTRIWFRIAKKCVGIPTSQWRRC